MQTGIAIYLGLDNTFEENLALIDSAAACGVQRIFTSFHIPETDITAFLIWRSIFFFFWTLS